MTGDAIFACFADNDGDVSGLTTYTACSAPATPAILSADDKGASSSDAITNDTTPAITGSCSTSLIHVYFDSVFLSTVGNDGVTCTSSGGTYTIPTLTPLADGIYTIDAMQSNGRGLGFGDSPFSSDRTLIIDTIPPTLTLEQKSGQSDPTNGSMVYRVVFSETIYTATFTTSDITLTGTGSGTVSSVSQVAPFDGTTFDVTINGTSDGTIIADISTNKVTDIAGNANTTASVSTDKTIEFDDTNPTVALTSLVSSPLSATFTVTATFSEAVSGLALGDFTIGNGTAGNLIIVSPTVATIDVTPTIDGIVTVDFPGFRVIDLATNGNTVAPQLSRITDLTSPNVTIDQASGQVDPTITSDIIFTAVFDEALASFDCTDVTVVNGVCVSVTLDSGSTYTVLVNGYSSAVVATVDAGATTDIAGNGNNQSTSTDNSVTFNPPSGGGSGNTTQTPKKTGGSGFSIGTPTTKTTTPKTTAVPTTTNATATETSQTSITNTTTPIPLNAASEDTVMTTTAYDAQSFTKLQKQYGNEVITREFFQNRCVTDNGKPYFRSCENGYALKTTYEFHQNMLCEGFVTAKKSPYTDAATRRDVLTMALKMRTKKEVEQKKVLPFESGIFLDITTP